MLVRKDNFFRSRFLFAIPMTLLFCAFLATSISPVGGELTDKKNDIEQEIKKVKKTLNKKTLERKNISRQINQIDIEIEKTSRDLEHTQRELKKNKTEQVYLAKKLVEAQENYEQYLAVFRERLVSYYKNGNVSYLEVLLNSTSFSDFTSRLYYLRALALHDMDTLKRMQELSNEIKRRKKEMEEVGQRIENLGNSLVRKKNYSVAVQKEKKIAMQRVQNDITLYEKSLRELEEENRRIEEEIRRRQKGKPKTEFTGETSSPVCGRRMEISSYFGYRRRPTRGASENHRGIDIRAPMGASVCAYADGVVFSAGRRSGYGLTVIIEHSTDLMTLYAHGKAILVREGQRVKKGDVIMLADNTGTSTGSHLHFEVRFNGVAVDPMSYLK
ncbi:MAG: peptidoglycan DD-metalloendopeptidase family protein [bacterium]